MENILPASISRLDRSLPATPKLARSITEGLVLDPGHSRPQTPQTPEFDDLQSSSSSPREEIASPLFGLSHLSHLSFIKNQRNSLRSELKAQRIASAEAKASVAALRRLAFRLAVNISVKEKQIADAARALASSRKRDYVATRDAEKKIEGLKESLHEEERRNKEILETLQKVAMVTMHCALLY
jgi:hypothetical protein